MLKPLKDYVIIEKSASEEKTKSGIVLPQNLKEEKNIGIVKAVGDGKVLADGRVLKMSVKCEDKVLYSKYGGTDVELDGKKYIVIREDDILAIF